MSESFQFRVILGRSHKDHAIRHLERCQNIIPESHFCRGNPSRPNALTGFLSRWDFDTSFGPFPRALDYFGDGSIDTPGAWEVEF